MLHTHNPYEITQDYLYPWKTKGSSHPNTNMEKYEAKSFGETPSTLFRLTSEKKESTICANTVALRMIGITEKLSNWSSKSCGIKVQKYKGQNILK